MDTHYTGDHYWCFKEAGVEFLIETVRRFPHSRVLRRYLWSLGRELRDPRCIAEVAAASAAAGDDAAAQALIEQGEAAFGQGDAAAAAQLFTRALEEVTGHSRGLERPRGRAARARLARGARRRSPPPSSSIRPTRTPGRTTSRSWPQRHEGRDPDRRAGQPGRPLGADRGPRRLRSGRGRRGRRRRRRLGRRDPGAARPPRGRRHHPSQRSPGRTPRRARRGGAGGVGRGLHRPLRTSPARCPGSSTRSSPRSPPAPAWRRP